MPTPQKNMGEQKNIVAQNSTKLCQNRGQGDVGLLISINKTNNTINAGASGLVIPQSK